MNGENLSFLKLIKLTVEEFKKLEKGMEPNLLIFCIYDLNWSLIRRWVHLLVELGRHLCTKENKKLKKKRGRKS